MWLSRGLLKYPTGMQKLQNVSEMEAQLEEEYSFETGWQQTALPWQVPHGNLHKDTEY